MENSGNSRGNGKGRSFMESFGGKLSTVIGENPEERAERMRHAADEEKRPEAAADGSAPPTDRKEEASARRGRTIAIILAALLAAGTILAAALDPAGLGLTGAQAPPGAKTPKPSSPTANKTGSTDAALFLYAQPWDGKKHGSLKSLKNVKNLRYALGFFQDYSPRAVAAVPSMPCALADVAANYDRLAGSMVSFTAGITKKDAVTEDLESQATQPSAMLTLPGGPAYGGASLIVLGSQLEGFNAGDTIKCNCIPIYYYSPKDDPASGGLLFITIPQLIYKVK